MTAPTKPVKPPQRPTRDAPQTMRELRIAREHRRRPAPRQVQNPLREGLRLERVPDPCTLVLFGSTGDLAHRKVHELASREKARRAAALTPAPLRGFDRIAVSATEPATMDEVAVEPR